MRKFQAGLLAVVFLLTSILLGGCKQNSSDINESSTQRPKDELLLAIGSEPEGGFDPINGWGRYGSPLFQSTLLKRDQNMDIVMDLAKAYEVSEDSLSWTVIIREDVKFSDGSNLTADDVVFYI
jgi:ABC-type dipeptide transport system, periplasmic component